MVQHNRDVGFGPEADIRRPIRCKLDLDKPVIDVSLVGIEAWLLSAAWQTRMIIFTDVEASRVGKGAKSCRHDSRHRPR
jgi:hypothetical protein